MNMWASKPHLWVETLIKNKLVTHNFKGCTKNVRPKDPQMSTYNIINNFRKSWLFGNNIVKDHTISVCTGKCGFFFRFCVIIVWGILKC